MAGGFLDKAHPGQIFAHLAFPVETRAGGRAHVEMAREGRTRLVVGDGLQRLRVGRIGHGQAVVIDMALPVRSEEHTSELQSLMRISYAVFCLKKKTRIITSVV